MLIFGYVRQSSAEQVRFGYNLEEQERQIKDYCELHYANTDYELKIYTDAGKSGTNMKRPKLQQMLNDCKKIKPNVVIFHNIDRLSRELSDLWTMIKFFTKHKIKLVSVVSYIDLNSAYGTGNVLNEGLSAMIESMKISDRTIRAYKEAVKQGKYPFSGCPRGYVKKDKHLYITDNKEDVEIIKFIFGFIANNTANLQSLRRELYKNFNFRTTRDYIIKVIRNQLYIGNMEYKDVFVENYCEPIISKAIYIKANTNISKKKRSHTKATYYFKNKVFCSKCNVFMNQTAGTSKYKKLYSYYKCPKCKTSISQIKLIELINNDLDNLTTEHFNNINGLNDLRSEVSNYRNKQISLVEQQKNRGINVDDFYTIYLDYQNKIEELELKICKFNEEYREFNKLDEKSKKEIIQTYIKHIEITFERKHIKANILDYNNVYKH